MKFPPFAIRIVLILIFLAALAARFASTRESQYPYFRGESAMNYRDALMVAQGTMGELDRLTKKSNWPEGYRPARVRPVGVEQFSGAALKTATWLSDADTRRVAKRLLVFCFSLCVFTLYAITRNLWRSQTAGLLAAALAALFPPLVEATNGSEFGHTPFALVLITAHVLALQRFARGSTWTGSAGVVLSTFALVVSWELAPYYVLACVLITTLFYPLREAQRRTLAGAHLVAFLAAVIAAPHARASGMAFSWQTMFLIACFAQTFLAARFAGVLRGGAFIVVVTAVLAFAFTPLRAGAETAGLPALKYAYYRARFLFAKPVAPSLLPPEIRALWSADHARPSAHALLTFLLPFVFILSAGLVESRKLLRGEGADGSVRSRFVLANVAAAFGLLMFAVDRGAAPLSAVAVFPLAGLAGRTLERKAGLPSVLTAVGSLLVVLQLLWPVGRVNPTLQLARLFGIAHRDGAKVVWISLENTDLELVKFVARRTSTRNAFLGDPDVTALLLTFSGRTSVLLAGGRSAEFAGRRIELTSLFYADEARLYQRCRDLKIDYVLYSIDFLLDTTRYSPAYLVGLTTVPDNSLAESMQFSPESLKHFNLVYENDRYRLFKVVDEPEPVFITDHPPVYQRDVFDSGGEGYGFFRERINFLLLTYTDAKNAAAAGDFETAREGMTKCLQIAPRFTAARIALGKTLLSLGRSEEAKNVLMSVVQYAPDNAEALYFAADALVQMGEFQTAAGLLEILYTTTNDTDLLTRARLLEALIERDSGNPPDSSATNPAPD